METEGATGIQDGVMPDTVTYHDDPDAPAYYANIAAVLMNLDETLIDFGLRSASIPSEARSVAKIYLSLPHFKRLVAAMVRQLKDYETKFGVIETNPEARLTEEGRKLLKEAGVINAE